MEKDGDTGNKDGILSAQELGAYVYRNVKKQVYDRHGGASQTPIDRIQSGFDLFKRLTASPTPLNSNLAQAIPTPIVFNPVHVIKLRSQPQLISSEELNKEIRILS